MELCDVTIIENTDDGLRTVSFRINKADPKCFQDDGRIVTYWDINRKPHIFSSPIVSAQFLPVAPATEFK